MIDAKLPAPGQQNNPELYKIKTVDFEQVLQKRLEKKGGLSSPHSSADEGSKIDQSSKENKDLKQSTKNDRPSINVNNNVNTTSHSPTESNTPTMDDRSAYQKKVKGN
jgi:hypothetical protein